MSIESTNIYGSHLESVSYSKQNCCKKVYCYICEWCS